MIVGVVSQGVEAIVSIRLRGATGTTAELQAVLDTGFNEWLTLSPDEINSLGLTFREEGSFTLADGSQTVSRIFVAEVDWLGAWRQVLVVEMEGGSLVGMGMMRGFYLGIEVVAGGRVEVRALQG